MNYLLSHNMNEILFLDIDTGFNLFLFFNFFFLIKISIISL